MGCVLEMERIAAVKRSGEMRTEIAIRHTLGGLLSGGAWVEIDGVEGPSSTE